MLSRPLNVVFSHLRSAAERDGAGATDGELLSRFLNQRDDDALAALVERHAPMVWGVCRRVLCNPHDAEDAFQATFLVLVRKAGTVKSRELLANWLYGVAQQTAVRLRATTAKRSGREVQMQKLPEPAVAEARDEDLLSLLDHELSRLPERSRAFIVLCDLEGHTRKEVARQLGCPEGTVASGLARARGLLARRLTRRGLAVSSGSLAATLSHSVASADVPATVVTSAINVATLLAAGKAAGVISGPVAKLTHGVLKTMFLKKIMTTAVAVLAVGVAVMTGGSLALGQTEGKPAVGKDVKAPVAEKPMKPAAEQEKEPFTAWGKEVGGLQAGLGFKAGEQRAYTHGETVTLVVRVRNVGNKDVKFQYYPKFLSENSPTVLDETGKRVSLRGNTLHIVKRDIPKEVNLAVGKEIELYERELRLAKGNEDADELKTLDIFPKGKLLIQHEQVIGQSAQASDKLDPDLEKLATGKLEMEVKEDLTAWGKEVGGLQAGLGFKAGEKRAYHTGETAILVVRVRNVGKEPVKFEYLRQFFIENPPTVTDDTGKAVALKDGSPRGIYKPADVTLAPGKEIELYELNLDLSNNHGVGIPRDPTLVGTGKFRLQYERVLGNSLLSSVSIKFDPVLSKLATGKLELEVKEPEKVAPEKEPFTAWGKEVGGLQAGLGFKAGEKRVYTHGETVTLVVRIRNVGKKKIEFDYTPQNFTKNPPNVTDEKGERVSSVKGIETVGGTFIVTPNLAPGEEIELAEAKLTVGTLPDLDFGEHKNPILYGTGKFQLEYKRVIGMGTIKLDPALTKLATGKLELEVKEPFTAWGKEVGGLQAGLGFKAGEKRVYTHGETVTLVVRVRNVGKEEVTFEYLKQFLIEKPPTVVDADGKTVRLSGVTRFGTHTPVKVSLAPGREVELYEWTPALRPASEKDNEKPNHSTLYGTGKYQIHYGQVLGQSSSGGGFMKLDPVLGKLATGKLELEVKEAPAEKPKVLTPEEAVKMAGNATKPAVEFKVEFVTKAIQVKASGEKDAAWVHGHSPEDVCLGTVVAADDPLRKTRFLAILTEKAIKQFNKAGINDLEKHFNGKTVRVTGPISWHAYDGEGSHDEFEIVLDDMSQIEVSS